jgi:hypothetical protein
MRNTFVHTENPSGRISLSIIFGDCLEIVFPSGRSYFNCVACGEHSPVFLYEYNVEMHVALNHPKSKRTGMPKVPAFGDKVFMHFNAPETAFLNWEEIEKRPYEISL